MIGDYQESLNDAKAAVELQPTYMEAIERGKVFCLDGQMFNCGNFFQGARFTVCNSS